jgi:hypothetical protein
MGQVIRPWRFFVRSYVKWQIENKRAQNARDEALRAVRRARRDLAIAATPPKLKGGNTDGSGENPRQ